MDLCFKKAHIIRLRLKVTFYLSIYGEQKNPSSLLHTTSVITTKGNVNDKAVSKVGLVTQRGKRLFGRTTSRLLTILKMTDHKCRLTCLIAATYK